MAAAAAEANGSAASPKTAPPPEGESKAPPLDAPPFSPGGRAGEAKGFSWWLLSPEAGVPFMVARLGCFSLT